MAVAKKKIAAKKKPGPKAAAKKKPAPKVAAKKKIAAKPVVKKAAAKKPAAKKVVAKKSAPKPVAARGPSGLPEQMRDATLKILNERQAEDIVTIPLAGKSPDADYMIIASGRAGRQVTAIADYLRDAFYKLGVKRVRIEGMGEANWVLIDGGDVIVHLFRPEVRSYYDLDAIWAGTRASQTRRPAN